MTDQPSSLSAPRFAPSAAALAAAWGGAVLFVAALASFLYAYLVRYGRPAPPGVAWAPALADVALFSAFALHHSLFARTPLKAWLHRLLPPVMERSAYTWIASALLLAVCWGWRPVPGTLYTLAAPWSWLGAAAQVLGIALTVLGSRAIDVLDLAGVRPLLLARSGGHAAHVPLVTTGVYAIVRHPLYFGWALLVFGAPTMTATRAVFAVVSTVYLAVAIPWEERSLVHAFGAEYRAYQQRVRWRMFPFVY